MPAPAIAQLNGRPASGWRDLATKVAAAARELAARGWTPATAGNFSARCDATSAVITVSGRDKGRLTADDFLLIDMAGRVIEGSGRPSAETPLHVQLYRHDPAIGAVLHTHSPHQTLAGRALACDGGIRFEGYELLKALSGVGTHETQLTLPVFANTQDMQELAQQVATRLVAEERSYGYLIDGHGIYAWGADLDEAMRHLEAFDFLIGCELELRRLAR